MDDNHDPLTDLLIDPDEVTLKVREIAESTRAVANAANAILQAGMTKRALVILIQANTRPKVSRRNVKAVLDAIESFGEYVSPAR